MKELFDEIKKLRLKDFVDLLVFVFACYIWCLFLWIIGG